MLKSLAAVLALALSGCAIADRSDQFGAEWDIGIGGILSYIADVHISGKVGFSKTCPKGDHDASSEDGRSSATDNLRGFL